MLALIQFYYSSWQKVEQAVVCTQIFLFLLPLQDIINGSFVGTAAHCSGALIPVHFDVRKVNVESGVVMYCIWVEFHLGKIAMPVDESK